jgi:hypothetical protein
MPARATELGSKMVAMSSSFVLEPNKVSQPWMPAPHRVSTAPSGPDGPAKNGAPYNSAPFKKASSGILWWLRGRSRGCISNDRSQREGAFAHADLNDRN